MKQKIYFLRGLPASGKSTFARKKCEEDSNIVRVNKDDIRAMMGGRFTKGKEDIVLRTRDNLILAATLLDKSVIVDDTNYHPKHLERIQEISNGLEVEIIDFDTPVDECIKRDQKRDRPVGKAIIMDMYRKYVKQIPEQIPHDTTLPDAIIVDIDGTLAHMDGKRSPYDYTKVLEDRCDKIIRKIIDVYHGIGYKIIIVSGRKDECKEETKKWLDYNVINYDILHMRKTEDSRTDYIVKKEIYEEHIQNIFNIEFVLDDRDQVVNMWREQGLKCLQVQEGNF
jgi:predicted kinase